MGFWETYCFICGGPLHNTEWAIDDKGDDILIKFNKWLNNLYLITSTEDVILAHGIKNSNESGAYYVKHKKTIMPYVVTKTIWHTLYTDKELHKYGVVCHRSCYNLIHKSLKYKIKFANICRKLNDYNGLFKSKSNYGIMKKYTGEQYFEFYKVNKQKK